jgi:hypothetical protein
MPAVGEKLLEAGFQITQSFRVGRGFRWKPGFQIELSHILSERGPGLPGYKRGPGNPRIP